MPLSRHNVIALLDQLAPSVRDAFLASVNDITSEAQLQLIAGHLERGDIEAAVAAANVRPEFFAPLDDALRRAYIRGGVDALSGLPRLRDPFLVLVSLCASASAIHGRNSG